MRSMVLFTILLMAAMIGCGATVQPREVEVQQSSALEEAQQILNNYASGSPVTSEVEGFPQLITKLTADDPAKAKIVKAALDKIVANPESRSQVAKTALEKLK